MIYNDYTNDEIINNVKKKIENTIGIQYEKILEISKKIKTIYANLKNKDEFNNRYKEIYYDNKNPNNISEQFIKRMSLLNKQCETIEKGSNAFHTATTAMSLAYLINWELLDLTLFWNLDQSIKKKKYLTELDYQIYDYYCLLTLMYFEISEKLKKESKIQFEDKKVNTYNNEISKIISRIK